MKTINGIGGWNLASVAAPVAAALIAVLTPGCGGGGGGGGALEPAAADLTATWEGTLRSSELEPGTFELQLVQSGNELSGDFTGSFGSGSLTGSISGAHVQFTGHLAGGECTGTLSGSGDVADGGDSMALTVQVRLTCGGQPFSGQGSATLTRAGAGAGGEHGSSESIDALCGRFAECSGTSPTPGFLDSCRQAMAPTLQVVPDVEHFEACMGGLSCAELGSEAAVQRCMAVDASATACAGSTLHVCATTGSCVDARCPEVCDAIGSSFDHCGPDTAKGHDVCWCR